MLSRILLPFILILSSFLPCAALAAPHPWENDIALFERLDATNMPHAGSAVFVGSSSVRMWRTLHKDLAPLPVTNRGFGGSTIADCTYYIPRILTPYQPAAIILYAGDNDIAAGKTPEQVLADFRAFVTECRKAMPGIPIRFLSIKPSPSRWNLWEKSQKANELIRKYVSGQKNLGFIDVATPMLDQRGMVRADIFLADRLHMNAEGYRIWASVIKPELTGLLKAAKSSKPAASPMQAGHHDPAPARNPGR